MNSLVHRLSFFLIFLIPISCFCIEISAGGGLQLPLGETGGELPTGGFIEFTAWRGTNIKPLVGFGFATLGMPPSNINLYKAFIGVRYRFVEIKTHYHRINLKKGDGQEGENGIGIQAGVLIPLGDGGSHANVFYTSVPAGVGIGVSFNILRL